MAVYVCSECFCVLLVEGYVTSFVCALLVTVMFSVCGLVFIL